MSKSDNRSSGNSPQLKKQKRKATNITPSTSSIVNDLINACDSLHGIIEGMKTNYYIAKEKAFERNIRMDHLQLLERTLETIENKLLGQMELSKKYLNDKKGGLEESVDDDTGSDSSDTGKNKRSAFKYTSSQTYTINELMSGIIPLGTRLMKKARRMSRKCLDEEDIGQLESLVWDVEDCLDTLNDSQSDIKATITLIKSTLDCDESILSKE